MEVGGGAGREEMEVGETEEVRREEKFCLITDLPSFTATVMW